MSSRKRKLDELREKLNLMTGADLPGTPPPSRPTGAQEHPEEQNPAQPDAPLSIAERLGLMDGRRFERDHEELQQRRAAGDYEINHVLPGEIIGDEEAGFFLLRTEYPLDYHQGCMPLGAVLDCDAEHIAFTARDEELLAFDPRKTLFIDTETTGLAGGAGTVPFLIGVAYFTGGLFRLDQCFMRDYDDEEPMLEWLAELFKQHDTLVGYNSKGFDLPLMRARFIQNRIPFRPGCGMHYDLVHAVRRVWKRRLRDCSLKNVERQILDIERHGDVPSHLIPQIWLDYLHTRDARPLDRVFYHHKMDILSLVALAAWVCQCLQAPHGGGFLHPEDRFSIVRLHFMQKNYEEVVAHGNALLEVEDRNTELRRECLQMLGMACKRLQRFEEMEQFFTLLVDEFPSHVTAHIELAKHHEHRRRDLLRAEQCCRQALEHMERAGFPQLDTAPLRHRLARIRKKLDKLRDPE